MKGTRPVTAESLATVSDITTDRARRIIDVLQAAGVVREADDSSPAFVLTPEFGALHAGASRDEAGARRAAVIAAKTDDHDWGVTQPPAAMRPC